jgi:F0F1-type ATP synthase assembly protein I
MAGDPQDKRQPPQKKQRRQQAAAYQGAMEAVFSIVIATGVGYWADDRFGTSPRYLLIGAVIGFGAFVLRIVRMRPVDRDGHGTGAGRAAGKPDCETERARDEDEGDSPRNVK